MDSDKIRITGRFGGHDVNLEISVGDDTETPNVDAPSPITPPSEGGQAPKSEPEPAPIEHGNTAPEADPAPAEVEQPDQDTPPNPAGNSEQL